MRLHEIVKSKMTDKGLRAGTVAKIANVDQGGMWRFIQGQKRNPSAVFVSRVFKALDMDMNIVKDVEMQSGTL